MSDSTKTDGTTTDRVAGSPILDLAGSSGAVIQVQDLSRVFGKKQALVNVNLAVPRGSVYGIVGENGAGKTTLIRHILGLLKTQRGRVRVFDLDPVIDPVGVLGQIGYLSEDRDLPSWMTVGQLLRYNKAFYDGWDDRFASELREQFELTTRQKIRQLSRGQLARVGLLIVLAHRPELLILDEPSSGLDPLVRRDILTAIIRTVTDEGRTVLFSSHLLDEVERVADWVAMLHHGRIAFDGRLTDVLHNHRRLVLRYPQPQSCPPVLPGVLSCVGQGSEWTVLCNGGLDELKTAAASAGAEVCEEQTATLEEIFAARVHSATAVNK